ncbi:5'-methylthioadenosine/adenosylhomocysteine nucleosidase [Buchnera aphidicola]|uniref:5'-methylthioadenosine/adenosylhomocysteine nucleosidase n=1 Tax=Buchnera aphidicola TaxID=9 RepID=UPI003463B5A6
MKIGIVIAINEEITILFEKLKKLKIIKYEIYGIKLYSGYFNKTKIILTKSGIGKVSNSIACTILIKIYHVNLIINIGSAGKLTDNIKVFDIILANKICHHDINLKNFGYEIGVIPNFPKIFKIDKSLKNHTKKILSLSKMKYIEGLIVSGEQFINNTKKKQYILTNFPNAIAVDMESSAISQACFQFQIPYIIIKIISDHSNKSSYIEFKKNIHVIAKMSYKILKNIINKIKF